MLIFETPRVLVRKYEEQDFDAYYQLQVSGEVRQYISSDKLNDDAIKEKFSSQILTANKIGVWAMEAKEGGDLIGLCKVVHYVEDIYEIGYALAPQFWRKGFGKEIALGLVNYGFAQLKLKTLIAIADKRNIGSVKILESAGFNLVNQVWDSKENAEVLHFLIAAEDKY